MTLMFTWRDERAGRLVGVAQHAVDGTGVTVAPIQQAQIVEADQQRVFDAFMGKIASWWPVATHAIVPGAISDVRVERRLGGRIYEVHHDGSEATWGHITVWKPPEAISFTWEVMPGPDYTEVEIRFQKLGPTLTRVALTHHGWERVSPALLKNRERYAGGWPGILRSFAASLATTSPLATTTSPSNEDTPRPAR